jgi:ribosomal protein L31
MKPEILQPSRVVGNANTQQNIHPQMENQTNNSAAAEREIDATSCNQPDAYDVSVEESLSTLFTG